MKLIVLSVVGVYLVILAALYFMQRSMLYHPDPTRPEPADFGVGEMQPVSLETDDGLSLLAWWRPPADDNRPVMVFLHGNAGHIGYRAEKLKPYLERGWGVLLVAWRGYSGNEGKPTEEGLYADGRAALAFLDGHDIAPARRVVYGESLGGAVAVEIARGTTMGAVVLEASFTSVADVAQKMYPFIPVRPLVRDRYESLAKIPEVTAPVMVVHGEKDSLIPVRHGQRLLEAAGAPKAGLFVPGAGHNDLYGRAIAERVADFVEEHVKGSR
jgi:fermentation-respiration switch protein FrsA (DUF1100 family)